VREIAVTREGGMSWLKEIWDVWCLLTPLVAEKMKNFTFRPRIDGRAAMHG
jgi:hypothetical protein